MKKTIPALAALLLCTFSVLVSVFTPAHAQQLNALKSLPAENPLSYQGIFTMAQDNDGFMWFGTQNGLVRYDGYALVSFVHDSADESTLSSSDVRTLLVDRSGEIWAGTPAGLNLFDQGHRSFRRITSTTTALALSDDNINALLEDSNGNIWIATENGLNILFRDQKVWTVKHIMHSTDNIRTLSHNTVKALVQSATGTIWAATHDGISEFDLQGSFIKTVKPIQQNIDNPSTKHVKTLFMAKNGDIWIGTTGGGLLKFDHISDDFSHYQFDKNNPNSLPSNTISKIYQDDNNLLWIATDKGLSIYNPLEDKFYRYVHSATDPNSLANNVVLTIFEDSQKIMWLGTFGGVNTWNPNVTTFDQYSPQKYPQMADSHITAFSQAVDNQVYFTSYGDGFYRLNQSDSTIERMPQSDYFKDLSITSILAEKDVLWIGTRASGMYQVDLTSGKITANKNDPNDPDSISANSITRIIRDNHGSIWISTFHKGINRLNKNGSFTRFLATEPASKNGPSTNNILQIMQDHQGYLWLATYGAGINRFDPATKTFLHLSHDDAKPDSLSNDIAWVIFGDDDN
ncbi:MAG: diguanylate cyclase, partial [Psychrosphaera sp.]|nr:diguanylate cyclase [Psychrosphaera sp.]